MTSGTPQTENTTSTPIQSIDVGHDSLDLSLVMPSKEEFRQVFKNVSSMFLKNISEQVSKMDKMLNLAQSGQPITSKVISETGSKKFEKVYQLAEEEQTLTEKHGVEHGDFEEEEDDESTAVICLSPSIEEEFESDEEEDVSKKSDQTPLTEEGKKEKMNEKRKSILAEILSTEEYYVKGLLILDFIYKRQIEQKKIVDPKVLKTIFQDVDIVCNVNQKFLEELRKIYEKEKNLEREQQKSPLVLKGSVIHAANSNFSSLGELLNTYAHTFKLYANYISGYKKASAALSEEKKKNKQLSKFLDVMKLLLKEQGERITQLESFLVTPVQRIRKYFLTRSIIHFNCHGIEFYLNFNFN